MCGIVGYIGASRGRAHHHVTACGGWSTAATTRPASPSARPARRSRFAAPPGKLRKLEEAIRLNPVEGNYGIGHTRWATHGRRPRRTPTPIATSSGDIVVVHNGIIENYLDLRAQLGTEGHKFVTDTDSEVIAHLVDKYSRRTASRSRAPCGEAIERMRGVFAMAIVSRRDPEQDRGRANGPPAIIGLGDNEYFVASDTPGDFAPHPREGRLQALHAQGDLRAAAGGAETLAGRVNSAPTGQVFLDEIGPSRREELARVQRSI
jgi:glutamine---fructose-6-phosphate transaminase (isomerizing)